jgi:hypothetical protein
MNNSSKIVRTKTTNGSEKKPNEMHYKINFMTFSKYVSKLRPDLILMDYKFELYPYKWYDIRWIYEIPTHYFFHKLDTFLKKNIKRTKTKTTAMYFTVFIMESLLAWLIVELVKFVISKI